MPESITEQYKDVKKSLSERLEEVQRLETLITEARDGLETELRKQAEKSMFSQFDKSLVREFFDEPYVAVPRRKEEWYVIAPKFVTFQMGWLWKTTKSFNVFIVNRYMDWLANIPEALRDQFSWKPTLRLKVFDGVLLTGVEHQEEAWTRYRKHLRQRKGPDRIMIRRGHEFQLIAETIQDGMLPFMPKAVPPEDLRDLPVSFELRDYQMEVWKRFLEVGAMGVFWPFSAGKTFLGLYAMSKIKGPHLVVVPTVTLREQWEERLEELTKVDDAEILTYASYQKARGKKWMVTIYDEAHRLPANTYSRLATIRTRYRMGLSGTPYREDGRTDLIFALTGFPTGLDWATLMEMGVFEKPDITLFVVTHISDKIKKVEELLRDPVKTLIFCDSIDFGKKLSTKFSVPHIYGETGKRMEILKESLVSVVSRVGDEGISLPDIRRVIEVDFLFGSRRQEAQRMGRLFHGRDPGEHIILMTDEELSKYEKRLYAIFEKGWRINIVR